MRLALALLAIAGLLAIGLVECSGESQMWERFERAE
jgi:hypothetical protein